MGFGLYPLKGWREGMVALGQAENLSVTRRDILRLLKERGEATATELSEALGISRVAVHHHLTRLRKAGWVQARLLRRKRGRPAEVFSLTEAAEEKFFPRRYDTFALIMLDELESEFGEVALAKLFRRYREKIFARFPAGQKSLRARVKTLASFLNEEGYLTEWAETRKGFTVTVYNCPIVQVARRFQQACSSELELLEEVLGTPVERQCRQVDGDHCCIYFVTKVKREKGVKGR